jgi:hypothetical protein
MAIPAILALSEASISMNHILAAKSRFICHGDMEDICNVRMDRRLGLMGLLIQ